MFWSLVRPDRILPPITSSAAVTTSLEASELAVVMITCGGRNRGRMTHDGQRCERILRRLLPLCVLKIRLSAEDGRRYDAAHVLDGAMDRSVLVERPMSPQLIIIDSI